MNETQIEHKMFSQKQLVSSQVKKKHKVYSRKWFFQLQCVQLT